MRKFLIILSAVLICLSFTTDATAQRSRSKSKSGYNYKAHAKRNKTHAKKNTKRFKASGGDYTKMKCNRSKSKARRRR